MAGRSRRTVREGDGGTRTRGRRATRGDATSSATGIVLAVGVSLVVIAAIAVYLIVMPGSDDRTTPTAPPPPPPPVEEAIAAFVAAWNANDAEAIGAMASTRYRPNLTALAKRLPEKNDWTDGFPALGEPTLQRNDFDPPQVLVTFPIVDRTRTEVVIRFRLRENRWVLTKLRAGLK